MGWTGDFTEYFVGIFIAYMKGIMFLGGKDGGFYLVHIEKLFHGDY